MDEQILAGARSAIDRIDERLTALLVERMKQVDVIANWKKDHGLPVNVPEREEIIVQRVREFAGRDYAGAVENVFRTLFAVSCNREVEFIREKENK